MLIFHHKAAENPLVGWSLGSCCEVLVGGQACCRRVSKAEGRVTSTDRTSWSACATCCMLLPGGSQHALVLKQPGPGPCTRSRDIVVSCWHLRQGPELSSLHLQPSEDRTPRPPSTELRTHIASDPMVSSTCSGGPADSKRKQAEQELQKGRIYS